MTKLRIRQLLVAGGAGFLGAAFVRDRLRADPEILVTALDALRRPGAEDDLGDLKDDKRFRLVRGEILDRDTVDKLARTADATVNFVSEEYATDSEADGPAFARTDVVGTAVLLEAARKFRQQRFVLVSSADLYGPLTSRPSREEDPIETRTLPLAARASAEALTRAYTTSLGVAGLIARGVTAYGSRQPMNQVVARMITSALQGLPVMIDGDGSMQRDYMHVDDQVGGIARVLWKGEPGRTYNIGAGIQVSDTELADLILQLCGKPTSLKRFGKRGPHGSYCVDIRRMRPLGWEPRLALNEGLRLTIDWYRKNESWWRPAVAA